MYLTDGFRGYNPQLVPSMAEMARGRPLWSKVTAPMQLENEKGATRDRNTAV